ncbi:MAG TPA: amidase [Solirubrobacteraceae bacterium]
MSRAAGLHAPPTLDSLAGQAELLAAGEVSSVVLVERALARAEELQPLLGAFRTIFAERARVEAARADERLAAGERAPLLGVPFAVKDDIDVEGEPTAFGCAGAFPRKAADSELVRRLRAAGAVIVGKTNTPEVGLYPFTEGPAFGVTRNPWDLNHTPGGSSGGAAAAVAAGIVAAAVGSDGAGSVRIPAAWTGLVGVKPQRGRISTWPDAEAFNGLTCLGPLTRTVADAALLLDLLSGPHPGDLHTSPAPREPFAQAAARDPGRLRVALSLRAPFSAAPVALDPEIRAAVERVAGVLGDLGHDVVEADPRYGLMGMTLAIRGQAAVHEWVVGNVPDRALLDPRTRSTARVGRMFGGPLLGLARSAEPWLKRRVGAIFDDVDAILTPTTASPPLRVGATAGRGGWATDQIMVGACPYAWPWNVLGWPGVSVPAGLTAAGLPIGAQLLGREHDEATLLALAAQLEGVERWAERRSRELVSHGV